MYGSEQKDPQIDLLKHLNTAMFNSKKKLIYNILTGFGDTPM